MRIWLKLDLCCILSVILEVSCSSYILDVSVLSHMIGVSLTLTNSSLQFGLLISFIMRQKFMRTYVID